MKIMYGQNHNRKSIRLKGYDYSQNGLYVITIVTQDRKSLFGKINNQKMVLNNAGKMIQKIWLSISKYFKTMKLHNHIIMPNHIHGIIEILPLVGAYSISAPITDSISAPITDSISAPITDSISAETVGFIKRAEIDSAPTEIVGLSGVVQMFKRYTTVEYIKMVKNDLLPPFNKRIWQRNYWEHIIRNEKSYNKISEYIINNPLNWHVDSLNVANK